MPDPVNEYLQFRADVDTRTAELSRLHGRHLVCRPGCTACCTNLTVLPVEFEAIRRRALAAAGGEPIRFDPNAPCGFLTSDGRCAIYEHRPIICRTHGLPIAFADEDDGHSVSFCERNFSDAQPRDLDFGPENTLDLDELNDRLAQVNFDYLAQTAGSSSRIELSRLLLPE